MLLAFIGGLVAIGIAIWVTQSPSPLWAIILLMWGLERVQVARKGSFRYRPTLLGIVLGIAYLGLGAVVYYLKDSDPLWVMILVNWLAERFVWVHLAQLKRSCLQRM